MKVLRVLRLLAGAPGAQALGRKRKRKGKGKRKTKKEEMKKKIRWN